MHKFQLARPLRGIINELELGINSLQSQEIKEPQSQRPVYRLLASNQIIPYQATLSQITPNKTTPSESTLSRSTPAQIINEEVPLPFTSTGLKNKEPKCTK